MKIKDKDLKYKDIDTLLAKWRKEAEELDLHGMDRNLHPYERVGYHGGAERIRRMANELDNLRNRKENK